jgi:putative ABC transport system permease protein
MLRDLRHALRVFARKPTLTALIVLTLALGIGANIAVFSVYDQVVLSPLPLREPDRLVRIQEQHRNAANLTGATFHDLHARSRTVREMFAYRIFTRNLTDSRQQFFPEQIEVAYVSPDFFAVSAARPVLGHEFAEESYRSAATPTVVLSNGLWRKMFSADPAIVGQTVLFHGVPAVVVGVMPPNFDFPESVQAWAPLTDDQAFLQNRRSHLYRTIGRLAPGTTLQQASAEMTTLGAAIEADSRGVDSAISLLATDLQTSIIGDVRTPLVILLLAVGFVLLIACANVANLLLARAISQQKEFATRIALGATRAHLIRQSLTESLLLASAGGLAGCALGIWSVRLLSLYYPGAIPRLQSATLDWGIALFAIFISLVGAAIAGILPLLQVSQVTPSAALAGSGRGTEISARTRLRSAVLVSETALALLLLVAAGLLVRSLVRVQQINPGYDATNVAVIPVTLPSADYPKFENTIQFVDSALANLSSIPGVKSVAAAGVLPLRPAPQTDFELVGKPRDPDNEPSAFVFTATPDYFKTLSIPLISGRSLSAQDTSTAPTVVLINQRMVNLYYPGENSVGRTIIMKDWGDPLPAQIIGVVGDVRQDSLETDPKPAVYFSFAQFPQGTLVTYLLAKTDSSPQSLASIFRQRIWSIDKRMPVQVSSMEIVIGDSLARRRFMLTLLATFAGIALLLAIIGVYGVISHSVSQRTREFGIRLAVGAQRRQVLLMMVRQGLTISLTGVAIGLILAIFLTRAMNSLVFGVSASDPLTFAAVSALLLFVAIAASLLPAYRAMRVDPAIALRHE